jgi:hypothetical protein
LQPDGEFSSGVDEAAEFLALLALSRKNSFCLTVFPYEIVLAPVMLQNKTAESSIQKLSFLSSELIETDFQHKVS